MKKLSLILIACLFIFSCSKNLTNEVIENADNLKEISELSIPVDVDIINQYMYSSISSEFKFFTSSAKFTNEDSDADIEINGYTLSKNKAFPKLSRIVDIANQVAFSKLFKDKAGESVPIKITHSAHMTDLSSSAYLPQVRTFHSKYNKKNHSLELKWNVDEKTGNNIMLVKLHHSPNRAVSNLKFDMSSVSAIVDLYSLADAPQKDFDYILIDYVYGTAKIIETSNKKKVRIVSVVTNNDAVYSREGVE